MFFSRADQEALTRKHPGQTNTLELTSIKIKPEETGSFKVRIETEIERFLVEIGKVVHRRWNTGSPFAHKPMQTQYN